jgi:DNA polymerase I-like protein with 3'-5' exonuclease and polymerase domains
VCKEFDVKRDIAKRLTFGGIFQIGAKKFAETLASLAGIYMTEGECKPIVDNWRRMYPEFGVAYRQSEQLVRRQGWVPLLNGRYRSYFRTEGYPIDYPNSAWNRRVQGSLAKFNQLWLIAAEGWMADLPGHVVLNVHDSIVLEVPEGDDEEIAQEVASRTSAMASEMFETPMTVDVKGWEYAGENEYGDFVGAL